MDIEIVKRFLRYFDKDKRRINHALKVHSFARLIALGERVDDKTLEIIEITAILHDIGIKTAEEKYNSSMAKYQETEGPPVARKLLADLNVDGEIIDRVCFIIGHHHTIGKIDGIDFQIIVEADFLVNIDEDDMKGNAVTSIREKCFKTKTGLEIFNDLY
ncbi:MAG: phosphohydrolase [Clostridiales bacterium 43-6]|nr:MAG: phosphohydrolase [Clostridiales bacterium 43-6]